LRTLAERIRIWRAPLVALACTVLASCEEGVLAPKGPIGQAEKTILFNATAVMLAVVVPVIVLTLAFAWWYRAGNRRARYRPDWEYSGRIEMVVWSIPALIVVFLGGMAWISSHDLDPPAPLAGGKEPLQIDVVSMDWKWLFIYSEQSIATVNELTLPVGTPIHFRLTSSSVMNSFFIPNWAARSTRWRDGHATDPAGGRERNLRWTLGAIQRRRLLRHAVQRARRIRSGVHRLGGRCEIQRR